MNPELALWKHERRVGRMLLRYSLLLIAVLAIVLGAFYELENIHARKAAIDAIRTDARRLVRLQVDEETGLRGFDATHMRMFLRPYYVAAPALAADIASLQNRMTSRGPDRAALNDFVTTHAQWRRDVATPILQSRSAASNIRIEELGKTLVDRMRSDVMLLDAYYRSSGAAATREIRALEYAAPAAVALCVIVIAALGYSMERRSALREQSLLLSVIAKRDTALRLGEWRSKVIAMLAHDFKSTLSVVAGYSFVLNDFPDRRSDCAIYEAIVHACDELNTMTEEALLMARVSEGDLQVQKRTAYVGTIVEEIVQRYRMASGRDIRVLGPDLAVLGDASYLRRIFDNLVSNAVKYSPNDRPITIRIDNNASGDVEVRVIDAGPGIDSSDLPYVFDEYWRSTEASTEQSGAGIGLFIVKKLVDAHGGAVAVETSSGMGTTVRVTLPAAPGVAPRADSAPAALGELTAR